MKTSFHGRLFLVYESVNKTNETRYLKKVYFSKIADFQVKLFNKCKTSIGFFALIATYIKHIFPFKYFYIDASLISLHALVTP